MVISLDGNIGAGKTTAAEAVAVETGGAWFCEEGFDLMLEQVKADPKYWAALFQFHMFHCALATAVRAKRAFEASPTKIIVLDRSILGNRAFSAVQRRMGNIPEDVYAKYCQLVRDSREKAFIPDVVHVYCHATAQRCSRWIGERGRRGEENIPLEYLRMVERAHLGIIVSTLCTPGARSQVLVVDFELPVSHQQLLELVNAHAVHTATTETGIMPVIHPVSSHRGLDGISETDAVDIACSLPLERARACFHALTVKGYTENNMQIDLSMFYNDP